MFSIINEINTRLSEILMETGLPIFIFSEDGIKTNHDLSIPAILADISTISEFVEKPGYRVSFAAELCIWLIAKKSMKFDFHKVLGMINEIILNSLQHKDFLHPPTLMKINTVQKIPLPGSSEYNHFLIKKAEYKIEIEQNNRS